MGEMPPELARGLKAFLKDIAVRHSPDDCRTPGHIVIRTEKGRLVCGTGGKNMNTGEGHVVIGRRRGGRSFLKGKVIRVNERASHF